MPVRAFFIFLFCSWVMAATAIAQTIQGEVVDMEGKKPIGDVNIQNIYTNLEVNTNADGRFVIAATRDQLLEFKRAGYKTVKVRIPMGTVPPYFKIIMQKGQAPITDYVAAQGNRYSYSYDSTRMHDLYKHELDFPKMSTLDMIEHPFSALSKQNREIWTFQENYKETEQQKYVDRTFNGKLVTEITGLKGDSVQYYINRYKPQYDQLRAMNDYTLYNYIKKTVEQYRRMGSNRPRNNG